MIYFDTSATSLQRPPAVAEAAAWAIENLGNAGRAAYGAAMDAGRAVYAAREAVAALAQPCDPLRVAFTSGATESLNLLIAALAGPQDHIITTVLEHNSVLRPLYKSGCALSFVDCDDEGRLLLDALPGLLQPNTKLLVCTHGSNLLGTVTDVVAVARFCREHGLVFILDAAQTFGSIPVPGDAADFICFTGHKSLFGPQGTGGVIAGPNAPVHLYKTGGTGADSFARHQPLQMPDMLEAGTANAHGLHALAAGATFVAQTGLAAIIEKERVLTARFLDGLSAIPGVRVYGPPAAEGRLPVVALNVANMLSEDVCLHLWEEHGIAARPGSHCAPLAHRRFGTEATGMARFSFGWFNTEAEIDAGLAALADIARDAGGRHGN